MFSALLSFFGGSAFRMVWGELSHWWTQKQDHEQELARMQLQETIDAAQHARNLESLRLQNDLGIKTIQVQSDAAIAQLDADAFNAAVKSVNTPTGVKLIDAWNGVIRPLLATVAIVLLIEEAWQHSGPTEHVLAVCDAILGIYIADRSLAHRGK